MKRKIFLSTLAALALLVQASLSWGIGLTAEHTFDSMAITATNLTTAVTYTSIDTGWQGAVSVNKVAVAGDSAFGTDNFINPLATASIQANLIYDPGNLVHYAEVNPNLFADPTGFSTPTDADFNMVNSVIADSLGGRVKAESLAVYTQGFNLGAADIVTLSFNAYYNFMLNGFLKPGDAALGTVLYGYSIDGGNLNLSGAILSNLSNSNPVDQTLDPLVAINLGTLGQGNHNFQLFSYVAAEAQPVPEPGTIVLLGAGLGALALYRRRKSA